MESTIAIEESGAIHLCPIFYGEGLDSLYEQNKVKNCSTGGIIVTMITNQWKHFLSLIPAHEELSKFTTSRIKRKMRFLHQPVFSRLDKRKNREISEYERGLLGKILRNGVIPANLLKHIH